MEVQSGLRVGDWRLLERLGQGAYGEVWRAVHVVLGRVAALKIARDEVAVDRLVAEAKAQYGLEHPGIVRIEDVAAHHRPAYVVMELVEGRSLRRLLNERGRLEVACASAVLRQLMDALEYAHERGVVHGDLKPENVLVETAPQGGRAATWRVRLSDFMLGRVEEATRGLDSRAAGRTNGGERLCPSLRTHEVFGTAYYAAPEQTQGGAPIDHRVDLYALGVLLFEMLTGVLPQGRDLPSDVNPAVSWWWDHVYSRCYTGLERRYRSIAELRRDLDALAAGPRWGELPSQREHAWRAGSRPLAPASTERARFRFDRVPALAHRIEAAGVGREAEGGRRRGERTPMAVAPRRSVAALLLACMVFALVIPSAGLFWYGVEGRGVSGWLDRFSVSGKRVLVPQPISVGAVRRLVADGRYRVEVRREDAVHKVYVYRRGQSRPFRVFELATRCRGEVSEAVRGF